MRYSVRCLILAALLLTACRASGPVASTAPATPTAAVSTTVPATRMATLQPARSDTPALTATPRPSPPTAAPAALPLIAVEAPNHSIVLVDERGQTFPADAAPGTFYVQGGIPTTVWSIGPQGTQPLSFIPSQTSAFAAWRDPATGQARLAWQYFEPASPANSVVSRIFISSPDSSDARAVLEADLPAEALRVWQWSADGQRLYYSREPMGLGGYILFGGLSNLWVYNLADGSQAQLVAPEDMGIICLDDYAPGRNLVALHCAGAQISLFDPATRQFTTIFAPPEVAAEAGAAGAARFSRAENRLAFAVARHNPDDEQGWVAVSDTLEGPARLVATAPTGEYFNVIDWLTADTLALQSYNWAGPAGPTVWLVKADGTGLRQVADGFARAILDR